MMIRYLVSKLKKRAHRKQLWNSILKIHYDF